MSSDLEGLFRYISNRLICNACFVFRFVLDGYPVTAKQMELMRERSIIPYKVIDLVIPDQAIMQRGLKDRKSSDGYIVFYFSCFYFLGILALVYLFWVSRPYVRHILMR